jgi:cell wall-associated NlpC family hydrolase
VLPSANARDMASSRSTFSLSGAAPKLDPRIHAVRGDLADVALAGQLFAPHYAQPMAMRCVVISTMLFDAPSADGKPVSQLLLGETFMVLDVASGWAWGFCAQDDYVGYAKADALALPGGGTCHGIVAQKGAAIYQSEESAMAIGHLPVGAKLCGVSVNGRFQTSVGFVAEEALTNSYSDAASVAESLIDTPYVWGGRCSDGIDCSGLVQLSLALTGREAPRDSDMQQAALGRALPPEEKLARNDLVFFPGHVGIMADEARLIHATMHHGKTVIEPLDDVVARFAAEHETPILARKRLI